MNTSTGLRCGSNRAVGSRQQQSARNAAGKSFISFREACKPTRYDEAPKFVVVGVRANVTYFEAMHAYQVQCSTS
jgi:hypothetical protein